MLSLIGFYAVMAGVFTFGKQVVLYVEPFFISVLRLPLAGLIFILYEYFYNRKQCYISKKIAPFLITYGIAITGMDSCRFIALQTLPAANAALIASLAPFFAALFSYLFLDEKITSKKIIALSIGFCAILPVILSHAASPSIGCSLEILIIAYSAAFVSMLGFVLSGLFIKLITRRFQYSMLMLAGTGMVIGGLLSLLLSLRYESWNPLPFIDMYKGMPYIIYLFVTHNLIAYPLFTYLLKIFPLTLVAFAQLLTPLFTALFRWAMFGETITFSFVLSFVILSSALFVFYQEERSEGLIK